jgi:hypothetical protein
MAFTKVGSFPECGKWHLLWKLKEVEIRKERNQKPY